MASAGPHGGVADGELQQLHPAEVDAESPFRAGFADIAFQVPSGHIRRIIEYINDIKARAGAPDAKYVGEADEWRCSESAQLWSVPDRHQRLSLARYLAADPVSCRTIRRIFFLDAVVRSPQVAVDAMSHLALRMTRRRQEAGLEATFPSSAAAQEEAAALTASAATRVQQQADKATTPASAGQKRDQAQPTATSAPEPKQARKEEEAAAAAGGAARRSHGDHAKMERRPVPLDDPTMIANLSHSKMAGDWGYDDERPVVVTRVLAYSRAVENALLRVFLAEMPSHHKAGMIAWGEDPSSYEQLDPTRVFKTFKPHPSVQFSSRLPVSKAPCQVYALRHGFSSICTSILLSTGMRKAYLRSVYEAGKEPSDVEKEVLAHMGLTPAAPPTDAGLSAAAAAAAAPISAEQAKAIDDRAKQFRPVQQHTRELDEQFAAHCPAPAAAMFAVGVCPPWLFLGDQGTKFEPAGGAISRAYFKIREAVMRIAWTTARVSNPRGLPLVGIDAGASPGGWTQFLCTTKEQGGVGFDEVHAVDPAVLSDVFEKHKEQYAGAKHFQMRTDEYFALKEKEMAGDGAEDKRFLSAYVCDMNSTPQYAVEMLDEAGPYLLPGALICVTLKSFRRIGSFLKEVVPVLTRRVRRWSDDVQVRQLLANSQEVTVMATARGAEQALPEPTEEEARLIALAQERARQQAENRAKREAEAAAAGTDPKGKAQARADRRARKRAAEAAAGQH